jgi:hypothetical protein
MTDLPPLPEPDGVAEADKKPCPIGVGGYTCTFVDAWSEPLVRAYAAAAVAAERERCAELCEQWNATSPDRLAEEIRKGHA